MRQKECHWHAVTAGGECEAPGGGEIRRFHFGNHMAYSARNDGFFNRPERFAGLPRHHREALQFAAGHAAQRRLRNETRLPRRMCLADPQKYAAPGRLCGRQHKAGRRSPVSISCLCHLVQPAHAEPIREGNSRCGPGRPDQAFGFEGCKIHMFLFCSFCLLSIPGRLGREPPCPGLSGPKVWGGDKNSRRRENKMSAETV